MTAADLSSFFVEVSFCDDNWFIFEKELAGVLFDHFLNLNLNTY